MPQNLLLILAAIFATVLLLCFAIKRHGYCICILFGIVLGGILFFANQARNLTVIEPYLEQSVTITARVEDPYTSYIEDMVGATLYVEAVNGEAVSFACYCVLLPEVEDGAIIEGTFSIQSLSEETDKLSNYSDGIFAQAEYIDNLIFLGSVGGIRGFFIEAQSTLSRIIRAPFSKTVGGVLSAMTVGDRTYILDNISELYRKAGLSHILVVSGLHLSLICSVVMIQNDTRKKIILKSILTVSLALLLAGITGATASILRAVLVLLIYTIGELLIEQADSYTSLSLAGAILVLTNGYVVCNLSFQLSFLATLGVLLGSLFAKRTIPYFIKLGRFYPAFVVVYTSIVITVFATCATFPILVMWDMNISLLAVLSNLLTFWMIPFILIMGLSGALIGLIPLLGWLSTWLLTSAAILVAVMNKIVAQISLLPGAQLYFETEYAVFVCLCIIAAGVVAYYCNIRYRIAIPTIFAMLVAGIAIGNYYTKDIIKVAMLGTVSNPAVVISQNQEAIVLFRGGEYNTQMVESYLEKRDISTIALVIDLRMEPSSSCELEAQELIWLFDTPAMEQTTLAFGEIDIYLLNAMDGGVVVLEIGGTTIATTSGTVVLSEPYSVDILLATSSSSGSIVGEALICKKVYTTMSAYDVRSIYYGDNPRLWLHYGGEYMLSGVENGT
ncbi:MAG: ComEC/Rec2 family competence protein [Faecalibacterium sp.]